MVFIAKWSIESTDLLPNGQSSQPIYCQMVNRVNRFIAKWSIESTDLLPNGQSIYCQMVNRFIAKWSIDLLPNGQSIYCQMVNRFIAKWSIDLLPNGQSIYCQWSIWLGLGFRVQGLEMVRGQSIYCLPGFPEPPRLLRASQAGEALRGLERPSEVLQGLGTICFSGGMPEMLSTKCC